MSDTPRTDAVAKYLDDAYENWIEVAVAQGKGEYSTTESDRLILALQRHARTLERELADANRAFSEGVRFPEKPTEAMLRPFYECPPDELELAYAAMFQIVRLTWKRDGEPPSGR